MSSPNFEIGLRNQPCRMTYGVCANQTKMNGLRIHTNLVEFACHLGRNRFQFRLRQFFLLEFSYSRILKEVLFRLLLETVMNMMKRPRIIFLFDLQKREQPRRLNIPRSTYF